MSYFVLFSIEIFKSPPVLTGSKKNINLEYVSQSICCVHLQMTVSFQQLEHGNIMCSSPLLIKDLSTMCLVEPPTLCLALRVTFFIPQSFWDKTPVSVISVSHLASVSLRVWGHLLFSRILSVFSVSTLLPLKTVVKFSKVLGTVIILTPWARDVFVFFIETSETPIMKLKSYFQDSVIQKRYIQLLIGGILRWLPRMESNKSAQLFSFPFLSLIQSRQLLMAGFLRVTVLGLRQCNLTLQGQSCFPVLSDKETRRHTAPGGPAGSPDDGSPP